MDYYIKDLESLALLRNEKNLKNSIRKIKLIIDDDTKAMKYEQKLNKYYFACGCQEGSIAVFIALICCFFAWWFLGFGSHNSWWKVILVIMFSALMGKITGLLISNYLLKKMYSDLNHYFTTHVQENGNLTNNVI